MNIKFDEKVQETKNKTNSMYILILVGMLMVSLVSLALTFRTYNKYSEESFNNYAQTINKVQEDNATKVKTSKEPEQLEVEQAVVEETVEDIEEEIVMPTVAKVEPVKKENVLEFIRPVEGKIIKESSIDEVVYWETLDVWKIHEGIDIASDEGTSVKAIESGKVVGVKTDPIFGKLVLINHGQTVVSIYCNLDEKVKVKEGDTVKKGDVIGKVGNTAYGEIEEESHLHFELMKDSVYVDPADYILFD